MSLRPGHDVFESVPKASHGVLVQGSDRPGRQPKLCEQGRPVAPTGNLGLRKNQKETVSAHARAGFSAGTMRARVALHRRSISEPGSLRVESLVSRVSFLCGFSFHTSRG